MRTVIEMFFNFLFIHIYIFAHFQQLYHDLSVYKWLFYMLLELEKHLIYTKVKHFNWLIYWSVYLHNIDLYTCNWYYVLIFATFFHIMICLVFNMMFMCTVFLYQHKYFRNRVTISHTNSLWIDHVLKALSKSIFKE